MEAVAWLEGLEHSDHPPCTCPVIAAFVRQANDRLTHDERQRFVAYLPRLVGTVSKPHEAARRRYLVLAAARVFLPIAMRAIGFDGIASALEAVPDDVSYPVLRERCEAARCAANTVKKRRYADAAVAARDAASDAARAAAYAAASDAAAYAAATYAADAAAAAADAASAARGPVVHLLFKTLDGLLAIGPASPGFSRAITERVAAFRELIHAE
jgi:hypothetical protein